MRALLVLTLLVACSEKNPYYCEGHPENNCRLDADINAPQGCSTSAQCTNTAKPICEPTQQVCVACTDGMAGACGGTTPVCTSANTCSGCTAHGECASAACLPSGACGDDAIVAYVAAGGDDAGACTQSAPCGTISAAATKGKPYIKVQTDLMEAVSITGVNVTILGEPGTSIRRATQGPIFTLAGASNITLRGLAIRDGLGTTGHGIVVGTGEPVILTLDGVYILGNGGVGIIAQGASLTMSRSVVSGNASGGGNIATTFNISSSLFVLNGGPTSSIGGLQLSPSGAVSFKFNTVAKNASANTVPGINCVLAMTVANTIVSANDSSGNCTFEYSLFDPAAAVTAPNRAGDPQFKNTMPANPLAADYFRIQATSAAVDQGDPASTVTTDIDGDARPSGNAPDIGADEVH
jgi:hypothetical protein